MRLQCEYFTPKKLISLSVLTKNKSNLHDKILWNGDGSNKANHPTNEWWCILKCFNTIIIRKITQMIFHFSMSNFVCRLPVFIRKIISRIEKEKRTQTEKDRVKEKGSERKLDHFLSTTFRDSVWFTAADTQVVGAFYFICPERGT